jgi:phosphoglycerate dehydrogenase-like enzyme
MAKITVMVGLQRVEEADLAKITAVDPRVEVVHALYVDEVTRGWIGGRGDAPDSPRIKALESTFAERIGDTEVILGLRLPANVTDLAPHLTWVHSFGAGIDQMPFTSILSKGITITNSSGLSSPPIAEFCMGLVLMHAKRMVERIDIQRQHAWTRVVNLGLAGSTLGIVGPGHIGTEVARRAAAFDMRVLATRRSFVPGAVTPYVDEVFPRERMNEMLAQCDYVVVAVGLTDETRRMFGAAEFAAMKPGCFFINVARGSVVDEQSMVQALKDGPMGGAGLDVFEREPLPPESELWDLPNVIISPHNSAGTSGSLGRAFDFFCDNLSRYLKSEPMQNVIDPNKGY